MVRTPQLTVVIVDGQPVPPAWHAAGDATAPRVLVVAEDTLARADGPRGEDLGLLWGLATVERLVRNAETAPHDERDTLVLLPLPQAADAGTVRALRSVLQDDPLLVAPPSSRLFGADAAHQRGYVLDDQNPAESFQRLYDLVARRGRITPSRAEYGMHAAYGAALRSAALRGGVGAALTDGQGDVMALGTAEVPAYGGGQYWDGDAGDARDFHRGGDPATAARAETVEALLDLLARRGLSLPEPSAVLAGQLLADFDRGQGSFGVGHGGSPAQTFESLGRVVHAEMAALSTAARAGLRTGSLTMHVTARPCRQCLRHLVCAGLDRVVYLGARLSEPPAFHADSVVVRDGAGPGLRLVPFHGVAPGAYPALFGAPARGAGRAALPAGTPRDVALLRWLTGLAAGRARVESLLAAMPATPAREALHDLTSADALISRARALSNDLA